MSFCRTPRRRSPNLARAAGIALMIAGALLLLIVLPRWLWTSALAITMISVGFLLWRFS